MFISRVSVKYLYLLHKCVLTHKSEIPPELNTLANLQEWCLVPYFLSTHLFYPPLKCHLCTCVSDGKCIGNSGITLKFHFPFRFLLGWIFKKLKNLERRDYQLNSATQASLEIALVLLVIWNNLDIKILEKDFVQIFQLKSNSIWFFLCIATWIVSWKI